MKRTKESLDSKQVLTVIEKFYIFRFSVFFRYGSAAYQTSRYCFGERAKSMYSAGKYFYAEGGKLSDDLFFNFLICDDSLYLVFQVERYRAVPGKLI